MDGFADSVQLFVDRAKANANEVVRATGLKILARLIERSPVGNPELWAVNTGAVRLLNAHAEANAARRAAGKKSIRKLPKGSAIRAPQGYTGGRFRGNWQVSFGAPSQGETGVVDKSGAQTLATGSAVLAQFNAANDYVIYFVNNVPYAVRLEFGHSKQAPNGMVRVTAQEFQKLFNEAAAQVNK